MTTSRSEDAWKTFADSLATTDIGETITTHAYPSAGRDARQPAPASGALEPHAVTIPELPLIPIAKGGASQVELDAVDFEVTGVLGEGGMGRVLLARQRSLRRDVAIKVVKAEVASPQILDSLLAEAVVTGSLEHPSIVPVHALGRDIEGRPILAMKRIEGVSWRDLTRDPDDPRWASITAESEDRLDANLEILMAVCNAVHFAHSRGLVHRDIKLDNVMIGSFGEVYVVDWGIATRAALPGEASRGNGPILGTPSYLSPEMVAGDPAHIDARTDVYLLGATLHAVLTGRARHAGASLIEALVSARESRPFEYGTDVPAELAAICNKAMSKDPADRFQSALELRRAVALFRRHRGSIALSEQASARLAELKVLLAERAARAERGDDPRVHVLMTESRFGFMQALRGWKDNAAAKVGLETCLEVMIEHEIGQRDADGARALYAELGSPRPELARRIEALEADLREASGREARLRAMERDADLSVGARAQAMVMGSIVVGVVLLSGVVAVSGRALDARELLIAPGAGTLVLLVGAVIARRHLRTSISRRAIGMLVLLPGGTFVHRAFVMAHGAPEMAPMFQGDLTLGMTLLVAMGIALLPRMAWAAVPFALGAIATLLRPDQMMPIFAVSMGLAFVLLAALWLLSMRSRGGSPAGSS